MIKNFCDVSYVTRFLTCSQHKIVVLSTVKFETKEFKFTQKRFSNNSKVKNIHTREDMFWRPVWFVIRVAMVIILIQFIFVSI